MDKLDTAFSDRLRSALRQRIAEGTTVAELSDATGVAHSIISRFMAGKRGLDLRSLDRLHRIVRLRVET